MLNFMRLHTSSSQFYGKSTKATTQTVARPPRVDSRKQRLQSKRDAPNSGPSLDLRSRVLCCPPDSFHAVVSCLGKKKIKEETKPPLAVRQRRKLLSTLDAITIKKDPAITKKVVLEARLALPFASVGPP